jgi:hypothetical protein
MTPPSQIQPNSWASRRGFEILSEGLGFQPSMGIVFTFYKPKGVDKRFWVSISAHPNGSQFQIYASNYKNLKEKYSRVQGEKDCLMASLVSEGGCKFLLYCISDPTSSAEYEFGKMNEQKQDVVFFL